MAYCFIGKYNLMLDDKCRMRLPAKLRQSVGSGYVILYGADSLTVMPAEDFAALNEKFRQIPFSDVAARRVVADIMSSAVEPEEDAQGRFVLPQHSRDYDSIAKNVVVIGAGSVIEIWSEEKYAEAHSAKAGFEDRLSALGRYGI